MNDEPLEWDVNRYWPDYYYNFLLKHVFMSSPSVMKRWLRTDDPATVEEMVRKGQVPFGGMPGGLDAKDALEYEQDYKKGWDALFSQLRSVGIPDATIDQVFVAYRDTYHPKHYAYRTDYTSLGGEFVEAYNQTQDLQASLDTAVGETCALRQKIQATRPGRIIATIGIGALTAGAVAAVSQGISIAVTQKQSVAAEREAAKTAPETAANPPPGPPPAEPPVPEPPPALEPEPPPALEPEPAKALPGWMKLAAPVGMFLLFH